MELEGTPPRLLFHFVRIAAIGENRGKLLTASPGLLSLNEHCGVPSGALFCFLRFCLRGELMNVNSAAAGLLRVSSGHSVS